MGKKYTLLSILLVILALGLVILPNKNGPKETSPKLMLSSANEKSRYLSVDQITHRIIENDPSLLLIDLRPASQFKIFALPGSINVISDSILSASNFDIFSQPGKDKVFYANSDLTAEMAWMICNRFSLKRMYVMKGGLNEWFNTIIEIGKPSVTASSTDLELLSFRNAARQYFTGAGQTIPVPATGNPGEKVTVTRKASGAKSGGGC